MLLSLVLAVPLIIILVIAICIGCCTPAPFFVGAIFSCLQLACIASACGLMTHAFVTRLGPALKSFRKCGKPQQFYGSLHYTVVCKVSSIFFHLFGHQLVFTTILRHFQDFFSCKSNNAGINTRFIKYGARQIHSIHKILIDIFCLKIWWAQHKWGSWYIIKNPFGVIYKKQSVFFDKHRDM